MKALKDKQRVIRLLTQLLQQQPMGARLRVGNVYIVGDRNCVNVRLGDAVKNACSYEAAANVLYEAFE